MFCELVFYVLNLASKDAIIIFYFRYSMLMIDKMRKPVPDKHDIFDMERIARRAFSEPDGGNLILYVLTD